MVEETLGVAGAWRAIAARRRLLAGALAGGAVLGAAFGLVHPPTYRAGSEVLVQGVSDQSRIDSEVRIATSAAVLGRVATILNNSTTAADLASEVTASQLGGNVLRITATAAGPGRAQHVAQLVTEQYTAYSTELIRDGASASAALLAPQLDSVRKQLTDLDARAATLAQDPALNAKTATGATVRFQVEQVAAQRTRLLQSLSDLEDRIAQAQTTGTNQTPSFSVIEQPSRPTSPASLSRWELVVGGALLAPTLAGLGVVVLRRRDRRLYQPAQIARAAGAPLVALVAAPAQRGNAAVDELEALRYRRAATALLRSGDGGSRRRPPVALVMVAGDRAAGAAGTRLRIVAPEMAEVPVYAVAVDQPLLPDLVPGTRVVLVLSPGTLPAPAVLALSGACVDAGAPVWGVLVVGPPRSVTVPLLPARLVRATAHAAGEKP
jgi:uncharacterized protein involved in exopolysaccharide biosynthesis